MCITSWSEDKVEARCIKCGHEQDYWSDRCPMKGCGYPMEPPHTNCREGRKYPHLHKPCGGCDACEDHEDQIYHARKEEGYYD